MSQTHRATIHLEEAELLNHQSLAGDHYLLRIQAPHIAARARAGNFVHLQVDPGRPMRRPLSIMRVDAAAGWIELLYRVFGEGTALLARRSAGEIVSLLGPIGNHFISSPERRRPLLIGGGIGMPPILFLAAELRRTEACQPFVLLGSEVPFPFTARPSQFIIDGISAEVTAAMPLLEEWQIPSRLASLQGYAGCYEGYVTDLARVWLDTLPPAQCEQVELFACGPHPMLEAVSRLARDYTLPCQVSLEEFMACGVGGCAGCVVKVQTANGVTMQRVCVDGPIFHADQVMLN